MASNFEEIVLRHLGPPVKIEGIVRSLGLELDKKAKLDQEVSGQLERLSHGKFKISTNANEHYFRQRFTMAHELGHFMLHGHLIGDGVDDSIAFRSEPAGRFYNQAIGLKQESEANRFAARLLMPKSKIEEHATPGASIQALAQKFQVSKTAMKIRLDTLNIPVNGDAVAITPQPLNDVEF